MNEANVRIETDYPGEVEVPAEKLWGAQTQRSLEHFSIGADERALSCENYPSTTSTFTTDAAGMVTRTRSSFAVTAKAVVFTTSG
jgi:fumarate hydratase class II